MKESLLLEKFLDSIQHNSDSRMSLNKFYTSVLTAVLAVWGLLEQREASVSEPIDYGAYFGLIGIILCISWMMGLRSYRAIGFAKFVALGSMINESVNPFSIEWDYLNKRGSGYISLGLVESVAPVSIMVLFISILL